MKTLPDPRDPRDKANYERKLEEAQKKARRVRWKWSSWFTQEPNRGSTSA